MFFELGVSVCGFHCCTSCMPQKNKIKQKIQNNHMQSIKTEIKDWSQ